MSRSYRDLLGDSWNDVAPGVKVGLGTPVYAAGELNVFRANRGFAGLVARMIQLPPAGSSVPSSLDLIETDKGIEWRRKFGSVRATSLQFFRGDHLFEIAGPKEFELQMKVVDGTVEVSQVHQKLFGVPVPRFMSSAVEGRMSAGPDEMSWHVSITISHIWFGRISRYEGVMRAE